MPRMEETQFNALSLLLLFHYSRNTDNVDMEAFRKYTRKYITPFLKELPDEYSGYQQMEYIRCVSLENRKSLLAGCFMIHTLLFLLTAAP